MEKLYRRADGAAETPDGLLAVIPLQGQRVDEENSVFSFKSNPYGPSIRVQWNTAAGIAIIDADTAAAMVRHGYATGMTEYQVSAYNDAVEAHNALSEEDLATAQKKIEEEAKAAAEKAAAESAKQPPTATNIFEAGGQTAPADAPKGGDVAKAAATDAKALDDALKGGDNGKAETTKKAAPPLRS